MSSIELHEHSADSDIAEHVRTYRLFVHLISYSALSILIVLALMAIFLG